jgi:hypothetical protein
VGLLQLIDEELLGAGGHPEYVTCAGELIVNAIFDRRFLHQIRNPPRLDRRLEIVQAGAKFVDLTQPRQRLLD